MTNSRGKRIAVGVTGASGAIYAQRLVQALRSAGAEVHLIITPYGRRLMRDELGIADFSSETLLGWPDPGLIVHNYHDVGCELASGSFLTDGMIVCPCSSNSLAAIAAGIADNLLGRAAAVTIKEMRRLILVLREMPMSRVDLLNALRLSDAGVVICPASPGFYMGPQCVNDLVDFVVGKVLDLMNVAHDLDTRWADRLLELKKSHGEAADP